MGHFRKKPVVIEAHQFLDTPEQLVVLSEFMGVEHPVRVDYRNPEHPVLVIRTLEGNMMASVNDWIIKGVSGEYYPCKPDIFELTYETVE